MYNPEKEQTTQNTAKQNYPDLVSFYDTQPGNEIGLFYNAPEPNSALLQTSERIFAVDVSDMLYFI